MNHGILGDNNAKSNAEDGGGLVLLSSETIKDSSVTMGNILN